MKKEIQDTKPFDFLEKICVEQLNGEEKELKLVN